MDDRVGIGVRRVLLGIVTAMVVVACVPDDDVPISEARDELLGIVGDVQGATGSRYQLTDDLGHSMDGVKVIQIEETGEFAAVYHWDPDGSGMFATSLATSTDLLDWTWKVDLLDKSSQPTIAAATDGGYVVAADSDERLQVQLRL